MAILTLSREFGSEGDWIAQKVAQEMGYHLVDKTFVGEIMNQYGMIEFSSEYETAPSFLEMFNTRATERRNLMIDMLNRTLCAVAHHGNVVIVGRSGFAVLAGLTDVVHVRVQAPLSIRTLRVAERHHLSITQAENMVKEYDRLRSAFVDAFYNLDWNASHCFDVVINSDRIPPDMAVGWLVDALKAVDQKMIHEPPSAAGLKVDPLLSEAVFAAYNKKAA
ncbi:MAG TPA: cytidylate kinase-like family protein [Anaerolineaceae bacterium]|nr:cytidylate kinase-like family protein [Anaerolineaceae bacterium]HPN50945.1 cytidylate kinase-like family protein [Anaerolineaceae bacterium]